VRRNPLVRWLGSSILACGLLIAAAAPVLAGPYSRLQVLLPGESPAPGTTSGKTGSPRAQTTGVPFDVTVRACDATWNLVPTVTDAVQLLSSDASATLPAPAQLVAGTLTVSVTFNAGGTFTIQAHDQTDGTIPDATSSQVSSLVLAGFTFSRISQKNQYAGVPMTVTIDAVDAQGHVVSGYAGPVRIREITSYGDGRTSPETVTLSAGTWTGPITSYRADETSINRGNVNLFAWLEAAPAKNGTSDPFTVHPGPLAKVQIVVAGQTPLPGSVTGVTGTPSSQSAGQNFSVTVWSTDAWWNPVPSGDVVRVTSSDPTFTPATGSLSGSSRTFSVSLNTVGTQTLSASDQSNGSIQGTTSPGIAVIPSAAHHFAIATIASPVTAGVPVDVTVRAVDAGGNLVPDYAGDALLIANTGAGSISPSQIAFTAGQWTGPVLFRGAGGAVTLTCSDFSSPPHTGTSNSFTVQPGPFAGLQVLLPGETAQGGTADGKSGVPTPQQAGTPFTLTVRAVDAYWNLVSGASDRIALGSTDAFAGMPAETTLANGQRLLPVTLYRTGAQRIWASDVDQGGIRPDTSSAVTVSGGPFARLVVLAPGESSAPGTAEGRSGTATDQSINYAFTVTVLATDQWFNPVGGVTDVVHLTSNDPLAQLGADEAMVDGRAEISVRLATGGFQQVTASDATDPARGSSTTQVRAISSGFHLEASLSSATARAGDNFTLTVRVTNDAGSVIQEINSFVTVEVQNAGTRSPGRGTLLTTQFQLLQGQRSIAETYTFAEPIVLLVYDDAGNAPGVTAPITITPGAPAAVRLTSDPAWVGGNKHATLSALLVDEFDNGIPDQAMVFSKLSGLGTLTPVDSLTQADGVARADFLSARQPGHDLVRAAAGGVHADLDLETAFVDPTAAGGTVTSYPNPFHPPTEGTTLAWKLDDHATVLVRIFTQSGGLVREETFSRGQPGGALGLNEWVWDGRNGRGDVVASGGYVALVEAQGIGQTLHVMRRRIAVVR
jgi:hypothetical protein